MRLLEERIRKDGIVKEGQVLKVDSFINHQMDINLFNEMGKEFKRLFADKPINKILTIEASGIGLACVIAQHFDVPVVFAKKAKSINLDGTVGINLYELKENAAASNITEAGYVTRQEFEDTINQLKLFYDELIQNMSQANDKKVNQPAALQF